MPNSSNDDNRRSDENSNKNDNVKEPEEVEDVDVNVNVNILSRRDDVGKQGIVVSFMRTWFMYGFSLIRIFSDFLGNF